VNAGALKPEVLWERKKKENSLVYGEVYISGWLNISNQVKIISELVKEGLGSFYYQVL
jgi:hypothetical protein